MSSGENAKPPATFEGRNPFDISRRSGPEVAAEIAKRMAAWKQARTRTGPAPTTTPSAARPSTTIPSGDAKLPPIAAPVQPARMPKAGSQPAQVASATVNAGEAAPRVPYFAVSATRRAMPPAPSPKQSRPSASDDERAARTDEPGIMPSVTEPTPPDQDERTLRAADAAMLATPELPAAESRSAESAAIEKAPLQAHGASAPAEEEPSEPHPFESVSAAEVSEPTPPEPNETERRRAEARALKARWIAARDLDTLLERPAAGGAGIAQSVAVAASASPDADILAAGETGTGEDIGAEVDLVRSPTQASEEPDTAFEATAQVADPAVPAAPTVEPEAAAVQASPIDALDEAASPYEPTFAAPEAPETASLADPDAGREALDIAALDEMAGRREPTFDAPIARATPATFDGTVDAAREAGVEAPDEVVAPPRAAPVAVEPRTTASRDAADDQHALDIAALDAVAGRREPTFDPPVQPMASDGAVVDASAEAPIAPAAAEPAPAFSAQVEAVHEPATRGIAALEQAAGRKEPTFDEPVRQPIPATAAGQTAHIRLRPIETRIEARRVDTLRVDPPLTARRPIFPHIEPEAWDVPPMVAARASRERRGTGWAIGLGSVLLIAGITAPAAIWQQERQGQDQVALVGPAPATQQAEATPGSAATGTTTAPAPAQAALPAAPPEAPQPEATGSEPAAPAIAAQQPSEPRPKVPEARPADAPPATTLGEIGNSDDVNEAPIVPPPSAMENLKTASAGTPMVARPFEPEQGNGPFLRAPTTSAATVPVAGAPVQSAAVGVKPNLMGQLKPKAAAMASASKPVARKPVQHKPKPFFQQSPDQMFETLIETLSEGRPVNPATKPASPSSRR